jgi:hypothetical protein
MARFYFQLLENVRGRMFSRAADLLSGGSAPGGAADHDGRAEARLGGPNHGGGSVLRLCAAGRKDRPRVAITSKLVADLLTTAGANRALFVDLHAAQIQGFFNIPVDHLFASPVLVSYFRELNLPNLTVVSPDAGGVERARFFAKKMGVRWPSSTSGGPI